MKRSLRAQLSPNELSTLRRVGFESPRQSEFRLADLVHLQGFQLIENVDGGWRLTDLGNKRLAGDNAGGVVPSTSR